MSDKNDEKDGICIITANAVKLTVTDIETGRTFERTLPLDYYENHNGIRLRGENMQAQPAEIVFLSGGAVEHINELMGGGPDESRCDDEHHH